VINGVLLSILALTFVTSFVILILYYQRNKAQIAVEQEKAIMSGIEIALDSMKSGEYLYNYQTLPNDRIINILIVNEDGRITDSLIRNDIDKRLQDMVVLPSIVTVSQLVTEQTELLRLLPNNRRSQSGDQRAIAFLVETDMGKKIIIVVTK
jgi:hypothetical protein